MQKRMRNLLVAVAVAVGCGGGLKYKVDDAALDNVPGGERQAVFQAQSEVEMSRSEIRTAQSQLDALERDVDVAKAEKQQAELEVEKAATEEQSAIASRDENRHNAARHGKEVAALGVRVVEAKMDWLDQKASSIKAARTAAEAHQAASLAKVELEKAKVAKAKGIKPSDDFNPADYESQWKDKHDDWQSAKKDAESADKKTKEREEKWKKMVDDHAKMKSAGK
jgi:hypothetical protein